MDLDTITPLPSTSTRGEVPSLDPGPAHPPPAQGDDDISMDWAQAGPVTAGVVPNADNHNDSRVCYGTVIVRSGPHYALSTQDTIVAEVDRATCQALQSLEGLLHVEAIGVIASATVTSGPAGLPKQGIVPLSVNVYGQLSSADRVGDALSAVSAFLQHPFFLEPSCNAYFNPQVFRVGNEIQNLTHLVGLTEKDLRARTISDEVENILASLNDTASSDALASEVTFGLACLVTTLKDHQEKALGFIRQREDDYYWEAARRALQGLLNVQSSSSMPSYSRGGILADVMGLGKTLTMLSTIVSTLDISRQYPFSSILDAGVSRSKATMIVVSSAQVLNVWETEIQKHVKINTLKTCRFHGQGRPTSANDLIDYDVVLTTYATLSAEYKNRGVLHQVEWYRIVLDEAHWIRNQSSTQYKAAVNLQSVRRWCLTGTPIQNSLNDLFSLLSFLDFEPFSSHTIFHREILEPLTQDPRSGASRLRALLRTICLRRDERLLELPEPRFEKVEVRLDGGEKALYGEITSQCKRDIDDAVSSRAKIKKYSILFTAMTRARRMCNHGTFAATPITNHTTTAASPGSEAEQGCDFCNGADKDRLELVMQCDLCSECGRLLPSKGGSRTSAAKRTPRSRGTPSRHDTPYLAGKPDGINTPEMGSSSKIQAVINRLSYTEPGLVFSSWVTTLDLLARQLKIRGVHYLKIDGNVTYSARLRILEEFRTAEVPVLLMTVQTGAVGLNLTAANYVHIIEPQWNPAVEEQAIARAVRMGQRRTVTVIRYVVKSSVEENIVSLQRRKRNLAKFTLDGASEDGASGTLDDLRFVMDLDFKH
ncbi:SNF2 family N-terminal domain-containing protein [Parachaetomium inaequale]|uniref:SNF2 family N-terminal domain-containing protein n=1 Tax=Parachaetomium inaequale TaxID=2588326 RepID=A0AAN6PCG0_9PEZI|nr:SNF2 family N-terminal domain-containing protein [Parachaetomium inaequale]